MVTESLLFFMWFHPVLSLCRACTMKIDYWFGCGPRTRKIHLANTFHNFFLGGIPIDIWTVLDTFRRPGHMSAQNLSKGPFILRSLLTLRLVYTDCTKVQSTPPPLPKVSVVPCLGYYNLHKQFLKECMEWIWSKRI